MVENQADAAAIDLPLPLFVKPVAEGTGKGVTPRSVVRQRADLWPACEDLLARYRQAVLVETMCPGREFTTGILGSGNQARVLATMEVILLPQAEAEVYSYVNKERCEELVEYRLVSGDEPVVAEAERVALASWRALGCRAVAARPRATRRATAVPRGQPLAGRTPSTATCRSSPPSGAHAYAR